MSLSNKIINKIKYWKDILLSNIYYNKKKKEFNIDFYSDEEVVDKILNEKCSLARFGDGEFKWILNVKQNSFQDNNKEMSDRLLEVLKSNNDKVIIGVPYALKDISNYTKKSKKFWKLFIFRYGEKIKDFLQPKKYANTAITRFYMNCKDKSNCSLKIANLKRIWDKKDIVIIEGKNTKLGVNNDLLSNVKSIKRILVPSKNAFYKYNEIMEESKKIEKDKIILLAVGPTATILAYDLSKLGFCAVDLGHIDIEYEWYKMNAKRKIAIKGKDVNEVKSKENKLDSKELVDEEYNKSVISIIE